MRHAGLRQPSAVPIGKHRDGGQGSGIQLVNCVVLMLTVRILDAGLHRHDKRIVLD
jgi:hypothetical protein